jgi:hypothetical protein
MKELLSPEIIGCLEPTALALIAFALAFSSSTKKNIREAQDNICPVCGNKSNNLECHHCVPQCKGGNDNFINGVALCGEKSRDCHERMDRLALDKGIIFQFTNGRSSGEYQLVPISEVGAEYFGGKKKKQRNRNKGKRFKGKKGKRRRK